MRIRMKVVHVNSRIMDHRFFGGKSLRQGLVTDKIGHTEKPTAFCLKVLPPPHIKRCLVVVPDSKVVPMEGGHKWNMQRVCQRQSVACVGSKVGMNQRRPRIDQHSSEGRAGPPKPEMCHFHLPGQSGATYEMESPLWKRQAGDLA